MTFFFTGRRPLFSHLRSWQSSPSNQPMLASRRRRVKYLALLILLIHASNSVHDRTKLHRCALLSHHESPWIKLYRHGDASSFLNMAGLTRHAFSLLHNVLFVGQQPQRRGRGRPQLMESTAQLGLFLLYLGSTMGMKLLNSLDENFHLVIGLALCSGHRQQGKGWLLTFMPSSKNCELSGWRTARQRPDPFLCTFMHDQADIFLCRWKKYTQNIDLVTRSHPFMRGLCFHLSAPKYM